MNMNGALRIITPQVARRCFASASAVTHGHGHGHERELTPEGFPKVHPLFNDHPVAPVTTYDDWPVPVLSYKEGYEKHNKPLNMMLAASIAAFTAVSIYFWGNDVMGLKKAGQPKWYKQRKIGKGLGDID